MSNCVVNSVPSPSKGAFSQLDPGRTVQRRALPGASARVLPAQHNDGEHPRGGLAKYI